MIPVLACPLQTANLIALSLTPFVLAAAGTCAVMARRFHHDSSQAQAASQNTAQLVTRLVAKVAPYLECDVCGARLDPRQGVAIGLTPLGTLVLRCQDHDTEVGVEDTQP